MVSIQSAHIAFELWGVVFAVIAVVCVLSGGGMEREKRRFFIGMELTAGLLLFSDALAWGFRGHPGSAGYYMVRVSNFFVFFLSDVLLAWYHAYVCSNLFGKCRLGVRHENLPGRVRLVYAVAAVGMALVVISQFTGLYYTFDENNFYHRSPAHPLSLLIAMAGMAVDFSLMVQYRKNVRRNIWFSMVSYIVLPAAGAVALLFYYGVAFVNIAIGISMVFMFVAEMAERNQELAQTRIGLMLSQINPHFIYNTLDDIAEMCEDDPKLAAETVNEFADFLRENMRSLTTTNIIPFGRELEHTRNYLSIEKKRFGDHLNIVWDIREENFNLPALSLQPVVENAVRHGVTKKEGGGTVTIRSYRDDVAYYISVEDDGVGFDEKKQKDDGQRHIGIANVRSRLKSICGGTLTIRSIPGKGTAAEIRIPIGTMK